jgi:hypothetical protein
MDSRRSGNKLPHPAMHTALRLLAALAAAALLSSCASVSVDKVTRLDRAGPAPHHIYVQDFEIAAETFRVDRGGDTLRTFASQFSADLSRATAERVRKRIGVSASDIRREQKPGHGRAWLVTGRFLKVNQGSRALRATVGFGLGGTKLETLVTVYDLSHGRRAILMFVTTGGSNAQPGAAVGAFMPNYWLLSADVIVKGLPGLNADAIRTSRQIAAVLSEYMAEEGVRPSAAIYRSKKLGKWP